MWYQRSPVLRSSFRFGAPLPGFNSLEGEQWQKQRAILLDFLVPLSKKIQELAKDASIVRVIYAGSEISDYEVDQIIKADIAFAIGSFLLVFLWMWFHTRFVICALSSQIIANAVCLHRGGIQVAFPHCLRHDTYTGVHSNRLLRYKNLAPESLCGYSDVHGVVHYFGYRLRRFAFSFEGAA
jgi:hypothetical protein